MDTSRNEFVDLQNAETLKELFSQDKINKKVGQLKSLEEQIKVLSDEGRLIEFPIGQEVAINGYWFKVVGVQNKKELVLTCIDMTNGFKKAHGLK